MDRRIAMESQMQPLEDWAESVPNFAGYWIDQPHGGVINIAFAGDANLYVSAANKLAPAGSEVRLVSVTYSMDQLTAALKLVKEARAEPELEATILRIGVDPRTNRVLVGVSDVTPVLVADFRMRFGATVEVEQAAEPVLSGCVDRTHCAGPPLRAGIAAPTNAAIPCSLAFLVHKGSSVGWLTAGHCGKTVGAQWFHDGINIGWIKTTCWPNCLRSDSALGGYLNSTYSSYHVWRTSQAMNHVGSAQANNADDIGDYTCLNARHSLGWRCGYIDAIATVTYPGGIYFQDQRYATFAAYDGDSGGAVHSAIQPGSYYVIAYGVQSGCEDTNGDGKCTSADSGRGIYSHIYWVQSELGVTVCKTSTPCP